MNEHFDRDVLGAYLAGSLNAKEMMAVDRHLPGCAQCRALLPRIDARGPLRGLTPNARTAHLSFAQMEAYSDRRSDDSAAVEAHIAHCAMCRRELADMQAFAPILAAPFAASAAPSAGFIERLRAWFTSPLRGGMAAASVIALLVIVSENVHRHDLDTSPAGHPDVTSAQVNAAPGATAYFGVYDDSVMTKLDSISPEAQTAWHAGQFPALAALLDKPAASGNPVAQEALGLLAAQGVGMPQNPGAAEKLWRSAAAAGSVTARVNLALLLSSERPGSSGKAE